MNPDNDNFIATDDGTELRFNEFPQAIVDEPGTYGFATAVNNDRQRMIEREQRMIAEFDRAVVARAQEDLPDKGRKKVMSKKQRHLTADERADNHQPESDWVESKRGERCESHCSIEVNDIVKKFKLKIAK